MPKLTPLLIYRWAVFLLAGGYAVYMLWTADYSKAGGPFRFLTFWALLASFYCASRMIAQMEGRARLGHDATVSVTAVMNAMVVLLYWRLFFTDPALVRGGNNPPVPLVEYYIHLVGPILQWIDALFLRRAFRKPMRSALALAGVVAGYACVTEFVLAPLSSSPVGTVTTGLSYPFLNDMEPLSRVIYYGANYGVALVFLALFSGVGWLILRGLPRQAVP